LRDQYQRHSQTGQKVDLELADPIPFEPQKKRKNLGNHIGSPNGIFQELGKKKLRHNCAGFLFPKFLASMYKLFFVKILQQEADLHEGRAYLLLVNAHSFKHYFNSLRYKKIIFLYY
jgi:hypothetical protein